MKIIFYKKTDGALIGRRIAADTGDNIKTAQFWFDLFISDNGFNASEYGFLESDSIPEDWDSLKYIFDAASQSIINDVNYRPPTVSTSTIPSTNTDTGQTT
jgi:hypothetical protein